jgi:hypothetical protein
MEKSFKDKGREKIILKLKKRDEEKVARKKNNKC